MAKLYPYIFSDDARKQAEFYANAMKGEILGVMTFADAPEADEAIKDRVMHLSFQAAGITFFMSDNVMEQIERGNGLDLTLGFETEEEAHAVFNGLAEGGTVIAPLERMFWGQVFGVVVDPFGVRWQVIVEA